MPLNAGNDLFQQWLSQAYLRGGGGCEVGFAGGGVLFLAGVVAAGFGAGAGRFVAAERLEQEVAQRRGCGGPVADGEQGAGEGAEDLDGTQGVDGGLVLVQLMATQEQGGPDAQQGPLQFGADKVSRSR